MKREKRMKNKGGIGRCSRRKRSRRKRQRRRGKTSRRRRQRRRRQGKVRWGRRWKGQRRRRRGWQRRRRGKWRAKVRNRMKKKKNNNNKRKEGCGNSWSSFHLWKWSVLICRASKLALALSKHEQPLSRRDTPSCMPAVVCHPAARPLKCCSQPGCMKDEPRRTEDAKWHIPPCQWRNNKN